MRAVIVDAVVVLLVVAGAVIGAREGLARALWGFGGTLTGTFAGIVMVPVLLGSFELSVWVAIGALAVVAAAALATRALALHLEGRWRSRVRFFVPDPWNHPAGAAFGALVAVGATWMLGLALAGSALPDVAPAVNRSRAMGVLDSARLPLSHFMADRLATFGERRDFPRYVDVLTREEIRPVAAPPRDVVDARGVRDASASVLKVISRDTAVTADEGTAFVVAPGRMMTAAHVVDDTLGVVVRDGEVERDATVVFCDPVQDVAVLDVPGLGHEVLAFATASAGQPAVVVGYPRDRGLTFTPARVRERRTWQSSDIWGEGRHEHDALVVRGVVRGGDSGGPLMDTRGRVLGVVVASSRQDADTGYVLSADQVAVALDAARSPATESSTACHRS